MKIFLLLIAILFINTSYAIDLPETLPMQAGHVGEDTRKHEPTMYLTEQQAQKHRVHFKDGLLYDHEGNLFNSYDWDLPSIYIVDEKGDLYVSKYQKHNQFHHSSLSAGKPVTTAGDIYVKDGVIIAIDNRSGHYLPGTDRLNFMKKYLEEKGVEISKVKTYLNAPLEALKGAKTKECIRSTLGSFIN